MTKASVIKSQTGQRETLFLEDRQTEEWDIEKVKDGDNGGLEGK